MANSEIKAALRIFYREKSYAIINLCGLSLAIACCLILGLYLRSELTYDRHFDKHKQIFRIVNEFSTNGVSARYALTSAPLASLLKENYPEVKDYVRFNLLKRRLLIRSTDRSFYWDDAYLADENVFDIFSHTIIYGDPKTALKDPSSAAVSESFARKYFGDANPLGKTIYAELVPEIPRKITLVFRDLPENTHMKYSALFRLDDVPPGTDRTGQLYGISVFTYLLMPENYNPKDFKAISQSFFTRFMEARGKAISQTWSSWLQPLVDVHLHSDVGYDLPTGNKYYVYGFAAVAVFILLVACINYVNLAVARATRRAKEIGMRKLLGVSRSRLMLRFIGEAILFSLIAAAVGIALVELAIKLTPIVDLLGKPLSFGVKEDPAVLLGVLGLGLFLGFLSGLYPAVYLSSIAPLSALTSSLGGKAGAFRIREMLVLIQFTVSIIVIACAIFMAMQMRYVSKKELGFEKKNRLVINLRGLDVIEKYWVIKNELLQNSHIKGVVTCSHMIGAEQNYPVGPLMVDNKDGVPEMYKIMRMQVTDDFVQVMGMKMAAGRDFSKRLLTDIGTNVIVNETLVRNRGWKDPLGKHIQDGKVIGVLRDFHHGSLFKPIEPFAVYLFNQDFDFKSVPAEQRVGYESVMVIQIAENDVQQTLKYLESKFAGYDPKHPFEYTFLDDAIGKLYMSEDRLMKMTGIFSGICILISCLGLFGLAAYNTEQRSKEIGIRKVLGASVSQIILMLSRKTLWLVLAGSIVASAAAYYAMDIWLSNFTYRVGLHPLVFVVSAAVVILIAFLTIALQSFKTAQTNPAQTLRYE